MASITTLIKNVVQWGSLSSSHIQHIPKYKQKPKTSTTTNQELTFNAIKIVKKGYFHIISTIIPAISFLEVIKYFNENRVLLGILLVSIFIIVSSANTVNIIMLLSTAYEYNINI